MTVSSNTDNKNDGGKSGLSAAFGFLTVFPVGSHATPEQTARGMWAFPVVGLVIGVLVGGVGWLLSETIEPLLAGVVVVASTMVVTRLHHADGLADFADGLMAVGDKEKKRGAMRDTAVGCAGISAIVLYMITTVILVSLHTGLTLFVAIVVGEVLAKFSMVLLVASSKSANDSSIARFVQETGKRKPNIVGISAAITVVVLIGTYMIAGDYLHVVCFAAAGVGAVVLVAVVRAAANRSFGTVTGDTAGALNELVRLATLAVFAGGYVAPYAV